jgi:hypothetical protein
MGYGLQVAVEDYALNAATIGLLNVSGIQTQAFNTSPI